MLAVQGPTNGLLFINIDVAAELLNDQLDSSHAVLCSAKDRDSFLLDLTHSEYKFAFPACRSSASATN